MSERNPDNQDGQDSFDERWQALADELEADLPTDLARDWSAGVEGHGNSRVIQPAWPDELEQVDDAAGLGSAGQPGQAGPRDWVQNEVEDHFEPPDPPPVLGGEPLLVVAWLAFLGGLAVLLVWAIFSPGFSVWVPRAGAIGLAVGLGLLFWRMPKRRDPDDDDSGAQV